LKPADHQRGNSGTAKGSSTRGPFPAVDCEKEKGRQAGEKRQERDRKNRREKKSNAKAMLNLSTKIPTAMGSGTDKRVEKKGSGKINVGRGEV